MTNRNNYYAFSDMIETKKRNIKANFLLKFKRIDSK